MSQEWMAAMKPYSYACSILRLMCHSHDVVQAFTMVAQQQQFLHADESTKEIQPW